MLLVLGEEGHPASPLSYNDVETLFSLSCYATRNSARYGERLFIKNVIERVRRKVRMWVFYQLLMTVQLSRDMQSDRPLTYCTVAKSLLGAAFLFPMPAGRIEQSYGFNAVLPAVRRLARSSCVGAFPHGTGTWEQGFPCSCAVGVWG